MLSAERYVNAFEEERLHVYPTIDAFEQRRGYAVDRFRLEQAAEVLACAVKANPPNWQHGRVIYAEARAYLMGKPSGCWTFLDIGTAKGFSALCLHWALMDHAGGAQTSGVTSVDVIDPRERVHRNTVAEVDGPKTLAEILVKWPETREIQFERCTGRQWLTGYTGRVNLAFVDGKHRNPDVGWEAVLLAKRQEPGDVIIFDDLQMSDVSDAVEAIAESYEIEQIEALPNRKYAIARKR